MAGKDITIASPGGTFGGYLATPTAGKGPGIVVIQEIFGVNGFVRAVADGFASRGYFALAPDLFWRIEPNVQLTDKTEEEWKRAFDLMGKFNADLGVKDIQATISHLRHESDVNGKVGAVGYCLGGLLAYLTAARTDADASVGYYGVNIQTMLGEAKTINKPLMLHIAEKDQFVPPPAQEKIKAELGGNALVTLHSYAGADHAFARVGGQHYDKAAADLANSRSAEFFRRHLNA